DDERDARLRALLSVQLADRARAAGGEPGPDVAGPAAPPAVEADTASGRRRPPLASVVAAVVLLGLFAAGIGLTYAGTRILRSSTAGEVVRAVDDPSAPGYEALVRSTPTLAVLHDLGGDLDAITVLTLPDPEQGGGG